MILKFLILTTLLSGGIQAIPNVEQKPNRPSTLQEQVDAWATHNAPFNTVYGVVAGSPVGQQQVGAVAESNTAQQTAFSTQSAVVGNAGVQLVNFSPASEPAAVQPVAENDVKMYDYDAYHDYLSYYEDQVTAFPLHDEEDSDEEQEVWPPVGIFPPPPPPPIRPTYPSYYPTTKPPTRPTTVRPRPPQYPPLYPQYPTPPPKPPHYPQYPISQLPPLPQYPRPTTARPTTARPTTTQRPTTTTTPSYQKPGGGGDDVTVLENYQIISDKGINEYKLRLSNGLSDYKKITKKHIGKDIIYVQSGYYSVPVDPKRNKFNIIHYIADEKGYRIIGVQPCSSVHQCKALEE